MSPSPRLLIVTALAGLTSAAAEAPKVSGLVQVWYTQMLDSNLRASSELASPFKYYNLRSEYRENGFSLRRTELKVSGGVMEGVGFEVMCDAAISSGSILQDAIVKYAPAPGLEFRLGQFKSLQTWEGLASSSELRFLERSQLARGFGDVRDRGASVSCAFGDPAAFRGRAFLAVFNGMPKANDVNAQKDVVARLEMGYGKAQSFGLYALQGSTDQNDKLKADGTSNLVALTFAGTGLPTAQQVLDHKDRSTDLGGYYEFKGDQLYVSAECISGLLGRRFASLGTGAGPAARQHLDQRYLGWQVTGGWTFGAHVLTVRYDVLDYNAGGRWYTAYNPYRQVSPGTPLTANGAPVDYTPTYRETTLGYTYGLTSSLVKAANVKVNYILRSRNFLKPNAVPLQTGAQGGDTLALGFQMAF